MNEKKHFLILLFAYIKAQSLPGTLIRRGGQLSMRIAANDGYQKMYLYTTL